MMLSRAGIRGWCLALVVAASVGCKPKPPLVPERPKATTRVALVLRATKESNGGRPMHVVVRSVTRKRFVEDDYSAVAALVLQPDETVVERIVVFPGQVYVVELPFDEVPVALGIYGLFTGVTGESWKALAERPRAIDISVGDAAFERVLVR